MKYYGRHNPEGHAKNALFREIHTIDEQIPADPWMFDNLKRHIHAENSIYGKDADNNGYDNTKSSTDSF